MEAAAQVGLTFHVDQARFAQRRGRRNSHGLAEGVPADFENTQAVHLTDARAVGIDQQSSFFDHFPNLRLGQVMPLDARLPCAADVGIGHQRGAFLAGNVGGLPRQIGQFRKSCGHFVAASRLAHAIFHHGRHRGAIEWPDAFLF